MRIQRVLPFLLMSLLVGCAVTSTHTAVAPSGDGSADAYVRAATARFHEAFNRGDWDAVSQFYTSDAVILPPNADAVSGNSGARALFSSLAPMKPNLTLTTDRVVQSCDVAYEWGTYTMNMTGPGGPISDRGKYLVVWRQQPDGQWKMAADTFNTSLPMPM